MVLFSKNALRVLLAIGIACLAACEQSGSGANSNTPKMLPDIESDKAAIWALEQEIYAKRAVGDVDYYFGISNPAYLGWPFGYQRPTSTADMRVRVEKRGFLAGEQIDVVSNAIAVDGDTAISYFSTHRTRLPGGGSTNGRYENIHVWARKAGQWTLIGSMSRQIPLDPSSMGLR